MFNRPVSIGAAVIGAVMAASLTAANACGPYGCGYGGYGYGYGYGGYGYGYAQPYYKARYQPCCRPGLWDSLFASHNCCVGQQPYYSWPYAGIGWGYNGAQFATVTPAYAPYIGVPRPYVRPWVRRKVYYRSHPRWRPYVGYRARVVTRPYYRHYRHHRYYR